MSHAYLGLGSNLGDRLGSLISALDGLAALGTLHAVSPVYETLPWGDTNQPLFLNLCCRLHTRLDAPALLRETKALERRLGRRPTSRWGPRAIDIDLLLFDAQQIMTPDLVIPHPGLATRAFVLAPFADIAPDVVVPGLGATVRKLLEALPTATKDAWQVAPPPRCAAPAITPS